MLAIRIDKHGGPEVLVPVEVPSPEPVDDEVLVRNAWIGVNHVDLQHREGSPYPVSLPLIPGTEAAGVVEAVGPAGDRGLIGRPVVHFGHLAGVYAERTAAPADPAGGRRRARAPRGSVPGGKAHPGGIATGQRRTTPSRSRLSAVSTIDSRAGRAVQPSSRLALSELTNAGTPT